MPSGIATRRRTLRSRVRAAPLHAAARTGWLARLLRLQSKSFGGFGERGVLGLEAGERLRPILHNRPLALLSEEREHYGCGHRPADRRFEFAAFRLAALWRAMRQSAASFSRRRVRLRVALEKRATGLAHDEPFGIAADASMTGGALPT